MDPDTYPLTYFDPHGPYPAADSYLLQRIRTPLPSPRNSQKEPTSSVKDVISRVVVDYLRSLENTASSTFCLPFAHVALRISMKKSFGDDGTLVV